MALSKPLSVSVPWSLSHYIPLNGYRPLYRALFEHAPAHVDLKAWDNVKLQSAFASESALREYAVKQVHDIQAAEAFSNATAVPGGFTVPDRLLNRALPGEIEFHHTFPYASMERPFVLHCELFGALFLPQKRQGCEELENREALRAQCRKILASPLCLGIFSPIPETLECFRLFFNDAEINAKLFASGVGLSDQFGGDVKMPPKRLLTQPVFLFTSGLDHGGDSFFERGGHIALRFWQAFIGQGRTGLLIMHCAKPDEAALGTRGIDSLFCQAESGRSIIWAQDRLAQHEIEALISSAHLYLLPGVSLDSVSIMQAMKWGAVPVLTDTIGTSVYVDDDKDGIVLAGVRDTIGYQDAVLGIRLEDYRRASSVDDALTTQMTSRILSLLDAPERYLSMQENAKGRAQQQFSGKAFGTAFWSAVQELHAGLEHTEVKSSAANRHWEGIARGCTLTRGDWARMFESPAQATLRIYTGYGSVWELGGVWALLLEAKDIAQEDWNVLAPYCRASAPRPIYGYSLDQFEGKYLLDAEEFAIPSRSRWIGLISNALMRYPELHSFATVVLKQIRKARRFLQRMREQTAGETGATILLHRICGYNIIRSSAEYLAVPQAQGGFSLVKYQRDEYKNVLADETLEGILLRIEEKVKTQHDNAGLPQYGRPQMVIEDFHGFNIVYFSTKFHAILPGNELIDVEALSINRADDSHSASSFSEVKRLIMSGSMVGETSTLGS